MLVGQDKSLSHWAPLRGSHIRTSVPLTSQKQPPTVRLSKIRQLSYTVLLHQSWSPDILNLVSPATLCDGQFAFPFLLCCSCLSLSQICLHLKPPFRLCSSSTDRLRPVKGRGGHPGANFRLCIHPSERSAQPDRHTATTDPGGARHFHHQFWRGAD